MKAENRADCFLVFPHLYAICQCRKFGALFDSTVIRYVSSNPRISRAASDTVNSPSACAAVTGMTARIITTVSGSDTVFFRAFALPFL